MGNLCTAPKSEFKEKVAINYSQTYKSVVFEAATGDIHIADVDAIVTRTDSQFSNNNSLGRIIIAEGGPGVQEEIDRIKGEYQNDIPAGTVIVTKAGNFKAQHIIHAVLPLIHENDEESFGTCVIQVLTKANENRVRSLAVPSFVVQSPHEISVEKAALSIVKNCVKYLDQVDSTTIQTIKFINNNQAFVKSFKDAIIRVLGSVGLEKDDIKLEREDVTNITAQTETPAFAEREREEITFERPSGHAETSHKRAALPTEDVEEVVENTVQEPVVEHKPEEIPVIENKPEEVPVVEAVQQEAVTVVVEEKVQEEAPVVTEVVVEEIKQVEEPIVENKPEEAPVVEAVQHVEEKQEEAPVVAEVVEEKKEEETPVTTEIVEEVKPVEEAVENKPEEAPVVENTEPVVEKVEEEAVVVEEKAPEEAQVAEVVEEKVQEEVPATETVEEVKPVEDVVVEEKKEEETPAVAENTEEQKQEEVAENKEAEGEGETKAEEGDKDGEGTPKTQTTDATETTETTEENQAQGQGKKKNKKGKKKN